MPLRIRNLLIAVLSFSFFCSESQIIAPKEINYLNYYAVSNTIDGQPLIDYQNVLRFFPVFAFRDSTKSVTLTIYFGNQIYSAEANRMDNGKYWQATLPKFELGDAIQKYEVETKISLAQYAFVKGFENQKIKINREIKKNEDLVKKNINNNRKIGEEIQSKLESISKIGNQIEESRIQIKKQLDLNLCDLYGGLNTLLGYCLIDRIIDTNNLTEKMLDSIRICKPGVFLNPDTFVLQSMMQEQYTERFIDSVHTHVYKLLTNSSLSGKSIQQSDLQLSPDLKSAKILYRNYSEENNYKPALDPGEKISIFRVRYVPFPIVGNRLAGPANKDFPVVFEAGVNFGRATKGNYYMFRPKLSLENAGIAFAFTTDLFKPEAKVLALALTYDVNAFVSTGLGVNFSQYQNPQLYCSIGINKMAFEAFLKGVKTIIK